MTSVLAASSCCLPILPFVAGAAFAGGSALLAVARPYLLAASVLFLAYGFYQGVRAKQCNRRPSAVSAALLWVSTIFVLAALVFPQALANAAANLLIKAPTGHAQLQNLAALPDAFNAAKDSPRLLLFFSPT